MDIFYNCGHASTTACILSIDVCLRMREVEKLHMKIFVPICDHVLNCETLLQSCAC